MLSQPYGKLKKCSTVCNKLLISINFIFTQVRVFAWNSDCTGFTCSCREQTRSWERRLMHRVKPSNALLLGPDAVCMLVQADHGDVQDVGCSSRVVRARNQGCNSICGQQGRTTTGPTVGARVSWIGEAKQLNQHTIQLTKRKCFFVLFQSVDPPQKVILIFGSFDQLVIWWRQVLTNHVRVSRLQHSFAETHRSRYSCFFNCI